MGQLRIRWGWLARGAGLLVAALLALQVLPGLLAPPEAPPLGADVGLPRVGREAPVAVLAPEPAARAAPTRPTAMPKQRPSLGISAATAPIGTTPRRRERRPRREPRCERGELLSACERKSTTAPAPTPDPPAPTPPPAPEAAPAAPSPAPPPEPEDGSLEFAPH